MCLFTNGSSEFKELFSSVVKIFFFIIYGLTHSINEI